ncbi:MAG TPA: sigma-54 dependent transcriptional regulator [Phycisphaerae bacterium]|jgi:DNA-binding NtrC family response regulator
METERDLDHESPNDGAATGGPKEPERARVPADRANVLIVEDERGARAALARLLQLENYAVMTAEGPDQAQSHLEDGVDLVLSDLRMGPTSGIDLLRIWKQRRPDVPFILMTAHGDITSAVEAMKLGAEDYLTKPVNPDELLLLIKRALTARGKDAQIAQLSERLDSKLGLEKLIGQSKPMQDVFARLRRAARSESTILVLGESGTGKELLAEALHQNSPRKNGPFIAVNMAAVPETLVESELFGHVKGAFTGATATRIGRFQAANGGTIFIDEIGDFAHESQAKLLRVLESRTITPVGANNEIEVDARVVAATARNLEQLVAAGKFRDDLYYRLSVVTIPLPPLRERPEDIPLLVRHFLDQHARASGRPPHVIDPQLMRFLETFEWPGNVRQLANALESMVVMAEGQTLTLEDLPTTVARQARSAEDGMRIPPGATIEELERAAVAQALKRCNGNRTRTAKSLGISVRTLQRKLNSWGFADSDPLPRPHPASAVSST